MKSISHPWLDDACFAVVEAKRLAAGTGFLEAQSQECEQILLKSYLDYRVALRGQISALPRSSKNLWRLNRELLHRKTRVASIPTLKSNGRWILVVEEKVAVLASTFRTKSILPQVVVGPKEHLVDDPKMPESFRIHSRLLSDLMEAFNVDKASGPDGLPARIFRECHRELAIGLAIFVRFLLHRRYWQKLWRLHRIPPLFETGAVRVPGNYRGVHLTNIIATIVERAIASIVISFVDRVCAFGIDQWAFCKARLYRDLTALFVCRWNWAMGNGFEVAIYLSNISGAFDRVDRHIWADCLRKIGVSDPMLAFLYEY